ncbi:hypothetical protein MKW98_030962, partial [Papaver atlanticum]
MPTINNAPAVECIPKKIRYYQNQSTKSVELIFVFGNIFPKQDFSYLFGALIIPETRCRYQAYTICIKRPRIPSSSVTESGDDYVKPY